MANSGFSKPVMFSEESNVLHLLAQGRAQRVLGCAGEGEGSVCSLLNMLLTTRWGDEGWQKQFKS